MKFNLQKNLLSAFGLLFLTLAAGAGVLLVQQQQLFSNKAATITCGGFSTREICGTNGGCNIGFRCTRKSILDPLSCIADLSCPNCLPTSTDGCDKTSIGSSCTRKLTGKPGSCQKTPGGVNCFCKENSPSCTSQNGSCKKGGCNQSTEDQKDNLSCPAVPIDTVCCVPKLSGGGGTGSCPSHMERIKPSEPVVPPNYINCQCISPWKNCDGPITNGCEHNGICPVGGGGTDDNKCDQTKNGCENKTVGDSCGTSKTCTKTGTKPNGRATCECTGLKCGDTGTWGKCSTGGGCADGQKCGTLPNGLAGCITDASCKKTGGGTGGGTKPPAKPPAKTKPSPSSNPAATPTPGPSPTPNPDMTIPDGLTFKLRFQGITSKRNDQIVNAYLLKDGAEVRSLPEVTISNGDDGVYILPFGESVPADTYTLKVKGHSHLQKTFTNVVYNGGNQLVNLSETEANQARAGDVTDDNVITIEDIAQVSRFFTDFSVPVNTDDAAMVASDINKDGIITIQDLALIAINWSDFRVEGDK